MTSLRRRYTLVVITRNLAQARRIADQIVLFWVREGIGTMIESGTPDRLFKQPVDEIIAAYIRVVRG